MYLSVSLFNRVTGHWPALFRAVMLSIKYRIAHTCGTWHTRRFPPSKDDNVSRSSQNLRSQTRYGLSVISANITNACYHLQSQGWITSASFHLSRPRTHRHTRKQYRSVISANNYNAFFRHQSLDIKEEFPSWHAYLFFFLLKALFFRQNRFSFRPPLGKPFFRNDGARKSVQTPSAKASIDLPPFPLFQPPQKEEDSPSEVRIIVFSVSNLPVSCHTDSCFFFFFFGYFPFYFLIIIVQSFSCAVAICRSWLLQDRLYADGSSVWCWIQGGPWWIWSVCV